MLILGGFGHTATAQEDRPTEMSRFESSVYLNVGVPVGAFGQSCKPFVNAEGLPALTRVGIAKDACIGLGGTYRGSMVFALNNGYIIPSIEASLFWNSISSDSREVFEDQRANHPDYINVPILVGITYRHPIKDNLKAFGEFGIGYDLMFITRDGKKDASHCYSYAASGAMAWQIGAGVMMGRHFSVGLHYFGLGKHLIDYTSNSNVYINPEYTKIDKDAERDRVEYRRIGTLTLRIGFHF